MRRVRIEIPHDPSQEYHDLLYIPSLLEDRGIRPFEYLDSLGRRNNGYTRWERWICNNGDCPARALVNTSWLEDVVNAEVDQ